MGVAGRVSTGYRRSVIFGGITISLVLILFVIYQLFSYFAPTVLCGGRVSCDSLTIIVNRIVFYGIVLSLVLFLPNSLKLSAFSVLFALIIVEAGYRIYESYLNSQYPSHEEEGGTALATYDAILGWKMNPNVEVVFSSKSSRTRAKVKTNSKGLRDEEYDYRKPPGVARILLLGDSQIAGMEVKEDEVLDRRLESLLSRHGRYEVINTGVRGYGTDQSYLFFRNEGHKYSPDIVIYVFVDNDPWENVTMHKPYRRFGKGYFKRAGDELVLGGVPVPREFEPHDKWLMSDPAVEEAYNKAEASESNRRRGLSFASTVREEVTRFHSIQRVLNSIEFGTIRTWLVSRGILDPPAGDKYLWPFREPKSQFVQDYEWDMTERLIVEMSRLSEAINAKFVVYESSPTGSPNTGTTRLETISAKLGVQYFNSFKGMYEASNGTRKFCFPLNVHWKPEGHDFVASAMYRFLLQNGFLPAGASQAS